MRHTTDTNDLARRIKELNDLIRDYECQAKKLHLFDNSYREIKRKRLNSNIKRVKTQIYNYRTQLRYLRGLPLCHHH